MTETQLFKRVATMLASTLAFPVIVALTTSGGSSIVKQKLASYLGGATSSTAQTEKVSNKESENPVSVMDKETEAPKPEESVEKEEVTATTSPLVKQQSVYTVREGDTYGCIAEKYYGSYDQWHKIYAANVGYAGYDEYELHVGAKLIMPELADEEIKPQTSLCS